MIFHFSVKVTSQKDMEANQSLIDLEKEDNLEVIKFLNKIPQYFKMVTNLVNLYLLPAIEMKYPWTQ